MWLAANSSACISSAPLRVGHASIALLLGSHSKALSSQLSSIAWQSMVYHHCVNDSAQNPVYCSNAHINTSRQPTVWDCQRSSRCAPVHYNIALVLHIAYSSNKAQPQHVTAVEAATAPTNDSINNAN